MRVWLRGVSLQDAGRLQEQKGFCGTSEKVQEKAHPGSICYDKAVPPSGQQLPV